MCVRCGSFGLPVVAGSWLAEVRGGWGDIGWRLWVAFGAIASPITAYECHISGPGLARPVRAGWWSVWFWCGSSCRVVPCRNVNVMRKLLLPTVVRPCVRASVRRERESLRQRPLSPETRCRLSTVTRSLCDWSVGATWARADIRESSSSRPSGGTRYSIPTTKDPDPRPPTPDHRPTTHDRTLKLILHHKHQYPYLLPLSQDTAKPLWKQTHKKDHYLALPWSLQSLLRT